jgi:type II secretory pathway predicted ATPase ExeA
LDSSGFLLVDSSFRPIFADPESIKILGYPNSVSNPSSLDGILTQKILTFLPRSMAYSQMVFVTPFQSGRRRYICRAFMLEDHWSGESQKARIALLLERGLPGPPGRARKYRKFGGMYEDPFSFSPDPRYYYFSRANQEVFASLRSMVRDSRGIGVLFSQAGMGKTILINYLAENLRNDSEIVVVPGSFDSRAEFVRSVMGLLGVESPGKEVWDNLQHFKNWLISKNEEGRRVILICDEAQDLSLDTLENLCLFSELEADCRKLIQVVLAGRLALIEKLTGVRLAQVSKGIHVCCRLTPMDEAEVRSYVLHRLRIAGCTRQMFTSEALSSIALYSRGIPLNINMLCRHCLSLAATMDLPLIDDRIVADSAYDLVLRTQPANVWQNPFKNPKPAPGPPEGSGSDHRGLKLIKKT